MIIDNPAHDVRAHATSRESRQSSRLWQAFGTATTLLLLAVALLLPAPESRIWWFPIALWIVGVSFAVRRFRERVLLFTFLMTFAFFLLSKPILMVYFDYDGVGWVPEIQDHLVLTLTLGLIGLLTGYAAMERLRHTRHRDHLAPSDPNQIWHTLFTQRLSRAAALAFFVTLPFSISHLMTNIETANELGYTGLYINGGGSTFASIAAYGDAANSVALALFLATIPKARVAWLIIVISFAPRAAILVTGDRGDFGTFLLMIFVYIVIRSRTTATQLMSRRIMWIACITGVATVIPLFITVGLVRGVGAGHDTIIDFLYGQGASLNVLAYGKMYASVIPDGHYMLLFADQGIFRLLFGGQGGLAGNSVEYALSGTSFSHSLSYTVLGSQYLAGRGVGSSYLAEAFADWGYIGVGFVGLAYGVLVAWVDSFPLRNVISNTLRLTIIPSVVFAPRGTATGFLADLLSPVTLVVLFGVWLIARGVTATLRDSGNVKRAAELNPQLADVDHIAMQRKAQE